MKAHYVLIMVMLLSAPCFAGMYFATDFSGPNLDPLLEDVDSAYTVDGTAHLAIPDRHYVRTVASNYNEIDFVLTMEFANVGTDPEHGNVYIGLGEGTPDSTYYGEPRNSTGLSHFNYDWHWMGAAFQSHEVGNSYPLNEGVNKNNVAGPIAQPKTLTLTKIGDTITIVLNNGVQGGAYTFPIHSLSTIAPYLNNTNSHLYFGCSDMSVIQFDTMSVTVPEPATMALLGLGALFFRRRRK